MKTRTTIFGALAAMAAVLLLVLAPRGWWNVLPSKPRMFMSTNYPPQTAEEKAMWDWWNSMRRADPDFEWKIPIDFYGKVVDQFGEPVPGADVECIWTTVVGRNVTPRKTVLSGADGRFELRGERGKYVEVNVTKEGYIAVGKYARKSFEYAAFFDERFHVPDPANPVQFRLQKLIGAEPMYVFTSGARIKPGGPPVSIDVTTGKPVPSGDISVSLGLGPTRSDKGTDYLITLRAAEGAGFVKAEGDFTFHAPENAYPSEMTVPFSVMKPSWSRQMKLHLYLRTRDNRYGVATFRMTLSRTPGPEDLDWVISFNPSGSRNLELDYRKLINRWSPPPKPQPASQ
jgi:hypothetical protein